MNTVQAVYIMVCMRHVRIVDIDGPVEHLIMFQTGVLNAEKQLKSGNIRNSSMFINRALSKQSCVCLGFSPKKEISITPKTATTSSLYSFTKLFIFLEETVVIPTNIKKDADGNKISFTIIHYRVKINSLPN